MRGIYGPTRTDIDAALRDIEAEEQRQREALHRFREACARERPGMFISWRQAAFFFLKVVAAFLFVWAFVSLWLGL